MKKIAVIAMMVMAANAFAPVVPHANAAPVNDALAALVAQQAGQNPTVAAIQQLASAQDGKTALINLLTNAAMARAGQADTAGLAATLANSSGVRDAVASAARQEVQQAVDAKLGPYKDGLALINQLFQNTSLGSKSEANTSANVPFKYHKEIDMTATAYAPGTLDNGRWNNRTYLGGLVRKGVVAVDPAVIPLGTKVWIEGYGVAVAEDVGSAIKGNRIDLAFNNRQEALNYGMKSVKVYLLD